MAMDTKDIDDAPPNPWVPEPDGHILTVVGKLGEESAELAKICCRIVIQGLEEGDPSTLKTNRAALEEEIADVLANIARARSLLGLDRRHIDDRQERKEAYLVGWDRMLFDLGFCPKEGS